MTQKPRANMFFCKCILTPGIMWHPPQGKLVCVASYLQHAAQSIGDR